MMRNFGKWICGDHGKYDKEGRWRLYRLCEAVEARLMMGTIVALVERGCQSVLLLKDGIYVHKEVNYEEVARRMEQQARLMGIDVEFRKRDLEVEFKEAKEEYENTNEIFRSTTEESAILVETEDREWGKTEGHIDIIDLEAPYRPTQERVQNMVIRWRPHKSRNGGRSARYKALGALPTLAGLGKRAFRVRGGERQGPRVIGTSPP